MRDVTNLNDVDASSVDFEFSSTGVKRYLRYELPQNSEYANLNAALGANGNNTIVAINLNTVGYVRIGEATTCNLMRRLSPLQLRNGLVTESQSHNSREDD